ISSGDFGGAWRMINNEFALESFFSSTVEWKDSICDLVADLRLRGPGAITIDGHCGSGKTTLGNEIASKLAVSHFDCDCFVNEGQERYLDEIRFMELNDQIPNSPGFVLSGILMLAIVERLSAIQRQEIVPVSSIYCVRRSRNSGIWGDDAYHDREPKA